jgi:putative ABC transport system permease protein
MLLRVLHRDIQRNKVITATLFFFVMLAALLTAGGTRVIGELTGAIDHLFAAAEVPSFIQMHTGEVNEAQVAEFARANSLVEQAQVLPTVLVPGSSLYLADGQSEANGVMDISFVTQSPSFDRLLNLENQPIQPREGEIAVPVYYLQKNGLSIGDRVSVRDGRLQMDFTITDFVRDAAMNPSLASSKRFLIGERDYRLMADHFGEAEHLIEFRLHDLSKIGDFTTAYQAAGMPQKGPTITYGMLMLLNALSDGLSAGVLLLISLLLMVIALLCLRFIILATLEEDVREIGTMKAIGIPYVRIRNLYLVKYVALSAVAAVAGYLLSFPVSRRFAANITLYMGRADRTWLRELIPLLAAGLCFVLVILFCQLILRRCRRLSAVDSLRSTGPSEGRGKWRGLSLADHGFPDANAFLAVNEVLRRAKSYVLLCFVFLLCAFIIIVPLNMLNTLESPSFATYLGAGQSDLRIDLQEQSAGDPRHAVAALRDLFNEFKPLIQYYEQKPANPTIGAWREWLATHQM